MRRTGLKPTARRQPDKALISRPAPCRRSHQGVSLIRRAGWPAVRDDRYGGSRTMTDRPIWQMSAVDLAAAISSRKLTSTEVVTAALEQISAKNPSINAIVDDLADEALADAHELDRVLRDSGPVGPLHGVPVTIKENVDQTGRATPNGVVGYKDIVAPGDAPVVRNLKRAGSIVVGRTNTPEFSFRATTDNVLHGRTFNPWNDWASAGGSSGGASAAVMSGMCAIGHGNDIG
ncbi:MAG: amidase, partial [Hyphomicrobiaceae bacterium]|nr:amidase [Hyphomicrobiaceae bacterium]